MRDSGLDHELAKSSLSSAVTYGVVSCLMVLLNKSLVSVFHFDAIYAIIFYQDSVCTLLLGFASFMRWIPRFVWDPSLILRWIPAEIFFLMMEVSGFYSYKYLGTHLVVIFKSFTIFITAVGDRLFFKERISPLMLGSMALLVVGSVMAGRDTQFTWIGCGAVMVNALVSAAHVLYLRLILRSGDSERLGKWGGSFYDNALSLPLLVPFMLAAGEPRTVAHYLAEQGGRLSFWVVVGLSGVLGIALSLSSMWCLRTNTSTTYWCRRWRGSMVGGLKIPRPCWAVFFGTKMSPRLPLPQPLSVIPGPFHGTPAEA
ncbi:putative GDP-mannose transporter GONST2 [Paratrimastix pyriformis]|uniref:GDP-mannose transporter GONST2 n=1 Tax=Paratrimastix pyriformis TaxID=342808 RepID=A0ABQ8UHP8_9EUKA|nr:putative GDP-mannose transporter GONST2 [Paratrimastix pyriformis]